MTRSRYGAGLAGTNTSGPVPRRRQYRPVRPGARAALIPAAPRTSRLTIAGLVQEGLPGDAHGGDAGYPARIVLLEQNPGQRLLHSRGGDLGQVARVRGTGLIGLFPCRYDAQQSLAAAGFGNGPAQRGRRARRVVHADDDPGYRSHRVAHDQRGQLGGNLARRDSHTAPSRLSIVAGSSGALGSRDPAPGERRGWPPGDAHDDFYIVPRSIETLVRWPGRERAGPAGIGA